MLGNTESLNASVATGIVIYEYVRQKIKQGDSLKNNYNSFPNLYVPLKERNGIFYESCKIAGNNSRILIVELCKRFMKLSFDLLSLTPIEKI